MNYLLNILPKLVTDSFVCENTDNINEEYIEDNMDNYKYISNIEKQRDIEIENNMKPCVIPENIEKKGKNKLHRHINKKYRKYNVITVFDVETTGLIPSKINYDNIAELPYIIQLSFIQYNVLGGYIMKKYNAYIKIPEDIEITEKITELTGITRNICNEKGISINEALLQLFIAYSSSDCVVAHNLSFDKQMIEIEMKTNYATIEMLWPKIFDMFNPVYEMNKKIDLYCTMMESIHICNVMVPRKNDPTKSYKKWPKLEELYVKLFDKKPENLHNSLIDTLACLRCFLKIRLQMDIHDAKYNYFYKYIMENDV